MTSRRFKSIIAAAITLCSISNESTAQSGSLRIACVGDSITFGAGIKDRRVNSYPAQLGTLLEGNATVRNFGVNGATLLKKGDKPYWSQAKYTAALEFKPDVVIIKLGTNDSKPRNWQHKSDYVPDYVELIKIFQNLESKPTVWICYPVPAYSERWGIRDKVVKEEIIPLIDEVAKQTEVKIIDFYSALSGKKKMFPDTVHPAAAGAKIMAETIVAVIANEKL